MRDDKRAGAAGHLGSITHGTNSLFLMRAERLEEIQIPPRQARQFIRNAALKPHLFQVLDVASCDGMAGARIRLRNAPGGRILLHPEDAGTPLAAALGVALERLGCLHRLGIASAPFLERVEAPWPGGQR